MFLTKTRVFFNSFESINYPLRFLHSHYKVPSHTLDFRNSENRDPVKITQEVVDKLERVSLVDCANIQGVDRLQSAIEFADLISDVNTTYTEPMISVLLENDIYLRDDRVNDGHCRDSVMANAAVIEEEYFVAPPGNIPVLPRKSIIEEHRDSL